MRRHELTLISGLIVVGLVVGFWMLILSPKRDKASELQEETDQLRTSLSQAQQELAAGEQARGSFRIDYRRLVVLGKAVPADSDQASLFIQLQRQAERSNVEFQAIDLTQTSDSAAAPPPTTDVSTTEDASTEVDGSSEAPTSTATAAPVATEAAAATLPIGASIGPAGLPVMPYDMSFTGGFFEIADFMKSLDDMVEMRKGLVDVNGRLLTVNGFTLTPSGGSAEMPELTAELNVTTFVTPVDQGVTAGATPTGPAPATPALASETETPAPTTESTATPAATATP